MTDATTQQGGLVADDVTDGETYEETRDDGAVSRHDVEVRRTVDCVDPIVAPAPTPASSPAWTGSPVAGALLDALAEGGPGLDGRVHDQERSAFVAAHVAAVAEAVTLGADVRGFFAWSLLDNFEWAWGYDKRFGLVHVDHSTQVRTVKDSGRGYAALVAAARAAESTAAGGRRVVVVAELADPDGAVPLRDVVAVHADEVAGADPEDDLGWFATQEIGALLGG